MQICLMYHDVFANNPNESGFLRKRDLPYKISEKAFEDHVKRISNYCVTNGFNKEQVVFTFDDGGKSFYSTIAPILERYGYKGLFFITTKYLGTKTFLNNAEILELHQKGHIIGSHAHTHEHLYTLDDAQVEEEWRLSTEILGKILGEPVTYASIPNGDTSKHVLSTAAKYGIKNIYTSEPTTKIERFDGMNVIGRYVILSECTTDYVMSIITSPKKRFILICKRAILKFVKTILGGKYVKLKNLFFR